MSELNEAENRSISRLVSNSIVFSPSSHCTSCEGMAAPAIDRILQSSYINLDCKINISKLLNFISHANKRKQHQRLNEWIELDLISFIGRDNLKIRN